MRYCSTHGLYEPGNPSIPSGKCPGCYQLDSSRRNRKARANGTKSAGWATLRQQRIQLDAGLCTFQLPGCTGAAETVHLDAELKGNHWQATLDNTRSACRHCHGVVDAPRSRGRGSKGGTGSGTQPSSPRKNSGSGMKTAWLSENQETHF
jgi:5-methylcytosine-specific restriction endonuclease McrA